jgi:LAO/AO transport system kinase
LKLAGAGDELQGIKRGIIEMADAIVINKADGENKKAARIAKTAFAKALHLYPPKESGWAPRVTTCSAIENEGIDEIWTMINAYLDTAKTQRFFEKKRAEQNTFWLLQTIESSLKDNFYRSEHVKAKLPATLKAVSEGTLSPFAAAAILLENQ